MTLHLVTHSSFLEAHLDELSGHIDRSHTLMVESTRFGMLSARPEMVFAFPDGIPGFTALTGLIVLPVDGDALFVWLQAVNDPHLAFLAVNPWPFFTDYELQIDDGHLAALGIETAEDAMIFCLVRPDNDTRTFHVNLAAPLVFGVSARRGRQVTLDCGQPIDAALALPDLTDVTLTIEDPADTDVTRSAAQGTSQ